METIVLRRQLVFGPDVWSGEGDNISRASFEEPSTSAGLGELGTRAVEPVTPRYGADGAAAQPSAHGHRHGPGRPHRIERHHGPHPAHERPGHRPIDLIKPAPRHVARDRLVSKKMPSFEEFQEKLHPEKMPSFESFRKHLHLDKPAPASGKNVKEIVDSAARRHGVNPRRLYGIIAGESAHGNKWDYNPGTREHPEDSWSMFQLNRMGGLGAQFEKETGLSVKDPKNLPAIADFSARYVKEHGTAPWRGYHGDRDWDPRWGSMGYTGAEARRADLPTTIPPREPAPVTSRGQQRIAEIASSLAGKHIDSDDVQRFISGTGRGHPRDLWCADFVGAALDRAGYSSLRTRLAADYLRYGTAVKPAEAQRGDVVIEGRHMTAPHPGALGHVSIAAGPPQMHNGKMMIPVISGDYAQRVKVNDWADAATAQVRRPPETKETAEK